MAIVVHQSDSNVTFLTLVNNVLSRLRETAVLTVTETHYSTLIGRFVNDAKRQVEDAFNWNCLKAHIDLTTTAGTSQYSITGLGLRFKDVVVNDTTNNNQLRNVPLQWIIDQQQLGTTSNGTPSYYAWNGSSLGGTKIELYPTPSGAFTLKISAFVPQTDLSISTDTMLVSPDAVVASAYARAIAERGEDGGYSTAEAGMLAHSILSDLVALEASRSIENDSWSAV